MASISSVGIGSGLNVKDIVAQLVTLEKKPLETLQIKAATITAKISAFGQIKSLVSTLQDSVSKLASVTGWNGVTASSSSSAVTVTAVGGTLPNNFTVDVKNLAQAQAQSSGLIPANGAVGAGTLTLQLGSWSDDKTTFTAGAELPVSIAVGGSDTVADVASKINGANAGVTATVLSDASGQRLLLRSKSTGAEFGFQMSVTDADGNSADASGLSRLTTGSSITQYGKNAVAKINGAEVSSPTNKFDNTVSGVTFTATAVTAEGSPAELTIARDTDAMKANMEAFVKAYNAVNDILNEGTAYDAAKKTGGLLQGDSAAVTLQNTLRRALQEVTKGGTLTQLSDSGIAVLQGGNLEINSEKLTKSLQDPDSLKYLFRGTDDSLSDGFAEKFKAVTNSLLSADGFFSAKDASLQKQSKSNADEQTAVNDKASNLETRLNARYAALDAQMASLNALNAYISQQVTTWNKSTG